MNERKKLNLLPQEVKNKYANKYLKLTAAFVGGFFILLLLLQYCHIGLLRLETSKILEDNQKYSDEQKNIKELKENIVKYESFLKDYENDCFPFPLFMYDIEACRPLDVNIISIDSSERLIGEGVQEEKEEKEKKSEKSAEEDKENVEEETDEKKSEPKIEYTEDLSGREIVIRGFGKSQESISKFIYDITHLSYL